MSIRKDIDHEMFEFPKPYSLEKRLKDFLEPHVDEKYYLSEKMISYISASGTKNFKNPDCKINLDIARPLTTDPNKRAGTTNYISDDLPENIDLSILIKEKTKKGYAEAQDGDGVYINRPQQKRGVVQKGMIQTIKTSPDVGVVVKDENSLFTETQAKMFTEDGNVKRYIDSDVVDEFKEGQCADISFPNGYNKGPRVHDECHAINTTTTTASSFVVKTKNKRIHKIIEDNDFSDKDPSFLDIYNQKVIPDEVGSLKAGMDHQQGNIIYNQLRIRKLTPKECFRLMGVKDEDFEKIAKNQSNTSLYHLAGDSIVITVLMSIFAEMLNVDYKTKIEEILKNFKSTR